MNKKTHHKIFELIEEIKTFYQNISHQSSSFLSQGTRASHNIDSIIFLSTKGTIDSIKSTLENGRISDSYCLLRKYHDSIFVNLYINQVLKSKHDISSILEDAKKDNAKQGLRGLIEYMASNKHNYYVEEINNWLYGDDKAPSFKKMSEYIKNSQNLKVLTQEIFSDKNSIYNKIRGTCNSCAHFNDYEQIINNDKDRNEKNINKHLDNFAKDLETLFTLHLFFIFWINNDYIRSSDYTNYLEMDQTPAKECLYWVAPFAQDVFDTYVKVSSPDIANIIKENSEMHIK